MKLYVTWPTWPKGHRIKRKKGFKQTKTNKNNIDWSEYANTLVKALGASNKRINSREDLDFTNVVMTCVQSHLQLLCK
jgi:hypothetical protein